MDMRTMLMVLAPASKSKKPSKEEVSSAQDEVSQSDS
jgi:hypothetical protein